MEIKKTWLVMAAVAAAFPVRATDSLPVISDAQRSLDRLQKNEQKQFIEQEKQREKAYQANEAARKIEEAEKFISAGHRFKIKKIIITDDGIYEDSPQRNAIISRYLNTLMGEAEILSLTRDLTNFYISKGYVTSQVTIVPGSLSDGTLVLKVLWGKIAGFLYNNQKPSWRDKMRQFSAMPFSNEKRLAMIDIDQALDNLLLMASNDKLSIQPAETSGYSYINHQSNGVFPLSVYLGVNNSGYREAGWYQYSVNTSLKNIIGLNDTLSYYYAYNDLKAKKDSQSVKSFSFNFPLGYWKFDASFYQSQYEKLVGGEYGGYLSYGHSKRLSFKTSRMLFRNAVGKTSAYFKVENRKNRNFIFDYPIAVSSKDYAHFTSGVSWVGSLAGGWGYIDLSMTAGIPWFSVPWKDDDDLIGFDLDYKKYNGSISWSKRMFDFFNGRVGLDYDFNGGFQFSNDVMVSDAKSSIGDEYTVRGYKETSVSAERTAWVANTVKLPIIINFAGLYSITPFVGFDIGMARNNCPPSVKTCTHDYMSGAAAGIKLAAKNVSTSFTAGWPMKKPASLQNANIDNYTLYFSANIGF